MKQRSDRWVVLRFGFGCISRSSVAIDDSPSNPSHATDQTSVQDNSNGQNDSSIIKKTKHPLGFKLPKVNLSNAFGRWFRSLKSVPRLFVYKKETEDEEEDEDEDEDEEDEIEIGFPTDVKHLTHIGWDGYTTTVSKPGKQWENLTPSEIISFPTISIEQFELAMAKQAAGATTDNNNI